MTACIVSSYARQAFYTRLVIADGAGALRILNGDSGRTPHTRSLPGAAIYLVLDTHRECAFILSAASRNTWLTTLNTRSGAVVHTLALPVSATALALDDQAGRLFVLDEGGLEQLPDPWRGVPAWAPRGLARWLPFLPRPGAFTRVLPPRVLMFDETRLVA